MVFLTPLFLLGLLAALIPVAIHLIRKEKPPKVMFSTIRFLKKTSKKLISVSTYPTVVVVSTQIGGYRLVGIRLREAAVRSDGGATA